MANDDGGLGDIFDFTFTKFITPTVVKVIYILVLVFLALGWIAIVIGGFSSSFAAGIGAIVFGTLFVLVWVLLYLVILEITIVIFRIKENTDVMARNSGGGAP